MRVFLTGATGFVGSRVLPRLMAAGHEVIGLARSDTSAATLTTLGAQVHRGSLADYDSLCAGVAQADAVIHTAFDTQSADTLAAYELDRQAILAMGSSLNPGAPLILTSSTSVGEFSLGAPASELMFNPQQANPRKTCELAGQLLSDSGRDVRVVRLPLVHNEDRQGSLGVYIDWARTNGTAAYVGNGGNRWAAAHVDDVARLYVLVLEHGAAGLRYHAVAEEGVMARDVVDVVATGLGLPKKSVDPKLAVDVFDWPTLFIATDLPATSKITRNRLGWTPTGPILVEDLAVRIGAVAARAA